MSGKYVAGSPGWGEEHLHLWQVIEMINQAKKLGMDDESWVKMSWDADYLRERLAIVEPGGRCVHPPQNTTPVRQEPEAMGQRLVELGFVRHSDTRKPISIRLQVQDDATNTVITSIDLDEHQFAALLAGSVIRTRDTV